MSNTLEAKLKLDIAELIANQAKAQMETRKWIDDLRNEGRRGAKAVDDIAAATKRANEFIKNTALLNPWAPMTTGAIRYATAVQKAAEAQRSVQANPWVTAGASAAAAQQALQQRLAARAAAMQKMDAEAAAGGSGIISGNAALRARAAQEARYRLMDSAGSRGGRNFALGGAAMQVQDIAVQMQMGTKASIILAQQGSQLASYFGPSGMILGGLVAIGGAFYTAGQAAKEGLAKGVAEAAALKREVQGIVASGGLPDMIAAMQKVGELRGNFAAPEQGWSAFTTEFLAVFGGPTGDEKFAADQKRRMAAAHMMQELTRAMLDTAEKEQRIAEMRAAGNEKAAQSMEKQLALSKELARIQALDLPQPVKDSLAQTAIAKSGAGALAATVQEKRDAAARIAALQRDTEQLAESMLPDDQQLARLKARLQSILGAAGPSGGVSNVAALGELANSRQSESLLKDYREALQIQKEITAPESAAADRAASRRKQQAAEIKQQLEHAQAKKEQDDKLRADQTRAKNELAAEMHIDRLRVAGKKELADIEARRLQITREAYQIQQATGASEQQALNIARERDQLRQKLQQEEMPAGTSRIKRWEMGAADTEARRAAGWTHPSTRAGKSRLMGGVDDWWTMQRTASEWQQEQWKPSAWSQLQQRAAGTGMDIRQQKNAAATESRNSAPTVNLGTKEIEIWLQVRDAVLALMN